ncbi:MAG TPA: sulfurtransferase TusA family protein [Synergistaceae bacterium]|mgnify:CR=1 FL=1|nr:sulfurtransferase TusA family protein [Synergistaceae bacterium]HQK26116.1 sulfurtransferase TusA family protein [Synergistaceae bacterium]
MEESRTVDARGLSCPEPVLRTRRALEKGGQGPVEVLVDTVTSRENVARYARSQGWSVVLQESLEGGHRLILTR